MVASFDQKFSEERAASAESYFSR